MNLNSINHAERAHALLSPSGSYRWIKCTMSVPLAENYPETTSIYAEEGTHAHELAEWEARRLLELDYDEGNKPRAYDEDMQRYATEYAHYIKEQLASKDDYIFIESKVSLREVVTIDNEDIPISSLCFGTADCMIVSNRKLHIIDFKYGKGVEVLADHNTQMMMYAKMALSMMHEEVFNQIETVKLHIYQPRIGNISSWELSKQDLMDWYKQIVTPAIKSILEQKYYMNAGGHCKWCKHRSNCKIYATTHFDPMVQSMRLQAHSLTKEKIEEILSIKDDLINWLGEVSEKVTNDILNGINYNGFKVVEGRSVRTITDKEGAITYLRSEGYKEQDIFKPLELQNITSLQKLMGKKAFDEQMGRFISKPKGKPTLTTISDKRPDYVSEEDEMSLFN